MQTDQRVRPSRSDTWAADEVQRAHEDFRLTGDPELRRLLVEVYRPLALTLARRYAGHREPQSDLNQCALLALLLALDRFEPERGVKFTTFAWATIGGELKRHYRDRTWVVRVPRVLQERFAEATAAEDALMLELGRPPNTQEIADRVGIDNGEAQSALDLVLAYVPASLDLPASDGGPHGGAFEAEDDSGFGAVEDRVLLAAFVSRLPLREQRILHLRFVEEMTQFEIGCVIGLSQMQVSRLLARSVASLRTWMDMRPV